MEAAEVQVLQEHPGQWQHSVQQTQCPHHCQQCLPPPAEERKLDIKEQYQ